MMLNHLIKGLCGFYKIKILVKNKIETAKIFVAIASNIKFLYY